MHVGDTALPLEDPGALKLDLLGSEALEQTTPLAEEDRDDVELDLVEDSGGERELRGSGAVDQHVPVARGPLGLRHRGRDVVHVGDERPPRRVAGALTLTESHSLFRLTCKCPLAYHRADVQASTCLSRV